MLDVILVLYNKFANECQTLKFVSKYKNKLSIYIFDNSTNSKFEETNKTYCEKEHVRYLTYGKNLGLSKAYNITIKQIMKENNKGYVLILDDDTILNDKFFSEIFKICQNRNIDIGLPIVYSKKEIISPSYINKLGRVCRIKSEKNISSKQIGNITGINSGMIINKKVFDEIDYNEDLFLEYIDHDFMNRVRRNNKKIIIMNCSINQNYSRNEKQSINSAKNRFKIYLKDYKVYSEQNNVNKLYSKANLMKYKLTNTIKYKNFDFLFERI